MVEILALIGPVLCRDPKIPALAVDGLADELGKVAAVEVSSENAGGGRFQILAECSSSILQGRIGFDGVLPQVIFRYPLAPMNHHSRSGGRCSGDQFHLMQQSKHPEVVGIDPL